MALALNVWDYVAIAFMLVVSASMGLYFRFSGGRQKTMEEFLMAGKSMPIMPVAFSLMATCMSAIAMLGIPAEIYMYGMQITIWVVGLIFGCFLAAYQCLPTFYELDVSTAYEYLEIRFGKTTRNVAAFCFVVRSVFLSAVVLYTPSLALNAVTSISTWTSILTLATVCVFYCSLGGLKAVLWTDVFQATLMYITLISVIVKGVLDIGFNDIFRISNEGGRLIFFNFSPSLTERYTFWNALFAGFYFGLEAFGINQAPVQRLLCVGNLKKAQRAMICGLFLTCIFKVFCFLAGMVLYAIFYDCDPMQNPEVHLSSPDQMIPYSVLKLLSGVIFLPGLCIAGMFSGALSSISSSLNSITAVFIEDFMKPYCHCKRLTDSWMNMLAKLLAIGFGGLSLLVILMVANFRGVLEASSVLTSIAASGVVGIYILAMFTTKANEPGALVGFTAGIAAIACTSIGSYLAKVKIETLPRSTAGCHALRNESNFEDPFYFNAQNMSSLFRTEMENFTMGGNITFLSNEENRYTPDVFKVSFMWYPVIGMVVTVIVGYLASFIMGFWISSPLMNPKCLSPFNRKYFPPKERT